MDIQLGDPRAFLLCVGPRTIQYANLLKGPRAYTRGKLNPEFHSPQQTTDNRALVL
jgi:hypothetical protein